MILKVEKKKIKMSLGLIKNSYMFYYHLIEGYKY